MRAYSVARPCSGGFSTIFSTHALYVHTPQRAMSLRARWTSTLPAHVRGAFLLRGMALVQSGVHDIHRIISESIPSSSWSGGDFHTPSQRDELQCLLIDAALRAQTPPADLLYLCHVTTDIPRGLPRAVLLRQRAVLFRVFSAQLSAGRFKDAAYMLRDARLRPSQPKHMLRMLLRRLGRHASTLSTDPGQSAHAALRETLRSFEYDCARRGHLDTQVFLHMLEHLLFRHMHTDMVHWAQSTASMVPHPDLPFLAALAALVHRMAFRYHAPIQAGAFIEALPTAWRTHAMYHDVLVHDKEVYLAGQESMAWRKRLWNDLRTIPHLCQPSAQAILAQLSAHAHCVHKRRVWSDWLALERQKDASPEMRARAILLVTRTFVRAGHTRFAVRFAERHASCVRAQGTQLLNTLLTGILEDVRKCRSVHDRTCVLRHMYECVWQAATRSQADRMPSLPDLPEYVSSPPSRAAQRVLWLLARVERLADTHALRPNVQTLHLLVRAATRWDGSMDSQALWDIAALALPHNAHTRRMCCTFFSELASALQRRADTKSALRARALLRHHRRRVKL